MINNVKKTYQKSNTEWEKKERIISYELNRFAKGVVFVLFFFIVYY
jgi:hypothetical protein